MLSDLLLRFDCMVRMVIFFVLFTLEKRQRGVFQGSSLFFLLFTVQLGFPVKSLWVYIILFLYYMARFMENPHLYLVGRMRVNGACWYSPESITDNSFSLPYSLECLLRGLTVRARVVCRPRMGFCRR